MTRPAILIHGPTASGKTDLAISLAQELGGEIVNADAMQVYADLRVLTARPSDEELARAPHHMFGHVDGAVRYNTGLWLKDAEARINDIRSRGRAPILAGGTGLYLSSLVNGLSAIPAISDRARREASRLVDEDHLAAHARLKELDPETAARIKPGDRQRLARALEVIFETGKSITTFHTPAPPVLAAGTWIGVALTPKRKPLYKRIEQRFDTMLDTGAPQEVKTLHARGLSRDLPVMRAHGVPGFCDYLEGKCSLEAAVERGKRDTRRYAKRQFTWIANQLPTWARIPSERLEARIEVVCSLYAEIDAALMKG